MVRLTDEQQQAADGQAMYDLYINESPNDVWAEEMEQHALISQYCSEQQEPFGDNL